MEDEICDVINTTSLAKALPYGEMTLLKLREYQRIDFTALQLLSVDYDTAKYESEEKAIVRNKKLLRDACLLHYDMDLSAVQRYCGGRWTGEHRMTDEMLRVMSHILPDKLLLELGAGLVDGVPNFLNAEIENNEL